MYGHSAKKGVARHNLTFTICVSMLQQGVQNSLLSPKQIPTHAAGPEED
jgi:hypothetical protein